MLTDKDGMAPSVVVGCGMILVTSIVWGAQGVSARLGDITPRHEVSANVNSSTTAIRIYLLFIDISSQY